VSKEFSQKLEKEHNLLLFSHEKGKEITFLAKVEDKEGLEKEMKSWEKVWEKKLFFFSEKKSLLFPSLSKEPTIRG